MPPPRPAPLDLCAPLTYTQGGPKPGFAARRAIDAACQKGDTDAAFAAFDAAVADGTGIVQLNLG